MDIDIVNEKSLQDIERKKELKERFNAKMDEKNSSRFSKKKKEFIFDKNLKNIGIDKEKFKADLDAVQKQGGLEINMKR
jgi:hypothetical protein